MGLMDDYSHLDGYRDGETFDPAKDLSRLNSQARKVFDFISDGNWHTLGEISENTGGEPEASVSARLRDFRKEKFGGYQIDSRRRNGDRGLWEYRLGSKMDEHEKLFKFWLAQGYHYRKRNNVAMQRDPAKYKERMKFEYNAIREIPGFIDYFLMVSDIVRWAKDSGIVVGPGRGSAAGALMCYLLRITEIDPLQFPMLFERFISAGRTDLPDIDIDFDSDRRDEVIAYAQKKYGHNKVANILTFTRYKGKNSLDDIARTYHIPEWKIEAIKSKLIERMEGHARVSKTLEDTYNSYSDLAKLVKETPALQFAPYLEGNYRNSSIHAAGVVISSAPLNYITAIYTKESGTEHGSGIAYDKRDAAYLGLLKIDLLGLLTLAGIASVLDAIGMSIIELYNVPLDDEAVYESFRNGNVLGIFQFEGTTTRRILKQVQPTKFMDLSDVNALARPGANDKGYISNKQKGLTLTAPHEIVLRHTEWTYGEIVYEEQILMILRDLGNFPPEYTNRIRKVIHDKLGSSAFNEYRAQFIKGAATHGVSEDTAGKIWDGMVNASGYAFNISHSVCYSHIAYWAMWLKVHYPEFYLGQLIRCDDDIRRGKLIAEAMSNKIAIEPPNLVESQENWTIAPTYGYKTGTTILAGFTQIPGIGPRTAENIIEWRNRNTSLEMDWDGLGEIKGIGPKTITKVKDFVAQDDPFGAFKTQRILDSMRSDFSRGEFGGIPYPTHTSIDLDKDEELVTFMGIARQRKYYDVVEQKMKYGSGELTREEIIAELDDPHLLKYVAIICEDEYDEPIRIRVSRKLFPRYQGIVNRIKLDKHVIIATGYVNHFGGLGIQIKEMVVIDPDG